MIQEMEEREFADLAMHHVKGPLDMNVLSSNEGIGENLKKGEHRILIPIGGQLPIECVLIEGNQSPSYISKNLFEKIKGNKEFAQVQIKKVSSGVLSKISYLFLETEYITNEKQYGSMKSASLSSAGFVLTCFHDEVGYQKTFLKAVESLAASSVIQGFLTRISRYTSRHINIIKINDNYVGVMENFVFETNENTVNYYSITNMLTPASSTELIAGESVDDVLIDKSTAFINAAKYYSYKNNNEEYLVDLKDVGQGKYKIDGTHHGQKIDEAVDSPSKIMHFEFIANKMFSDSKFRNKSNFQFYEYLANDPLKAFESKITIKSFTQKLLNFTYSSPHAIMDVEVDHAGISLVKMKGGKDTTITIERVFAE